MVYSWRGASAAHLGPPDSTGKKSRAQRGREGEERMRAGRMNKSLENKHGAELSNETARGNELWEREGAINFVYQ